VLTYSDCISVALDSHHAMRVRHIVIFGLSGSTVLFHILINGAISEKKKVTERK